MTSVVEAGPPSPARLWPTLVVVTGPAGSGKTTLAHGLAQTIGSPAICRDEIKEGMVHAHGPGFTASVGDPLTRRTYPLFFDVVRLLLDGGVTVVVEAAWQHQPWERGLAPLATSADLRVIRCHTSHEGCCVGDSSGSRRWQPGLRTTTGVRTAPRHPWPGRRSTSRRSHSTSTPATDTFPTSPDRRLYQHMSCPDAVCDTPYRPALVDALGR